MNVLITGAGGFIGSHLTEKCVKAGMNVKAFLHYNSKNNWGWIENSSIINDVEIITGDIRDYDSVFKSLKNIDTVFHLAALIGIPYSYVSPLAYIKTNIEGTYNVLEASKNENVKNLIITSTSETYGTAQYIPIDESHPLVGQSPYSASKISSDQLSLSYYNSFGMPLKIVRPFNTYGPRQSARAVIPSVICQILDGKSKIKLGNITPTRDLTYVKDTVDGFIEIMKSDKLIGQVTNIGMNDEISILELVKLISDTLGENIEIISSSERKRPAGSEVERLYCDNTKILKNTNWSPKYNLQSGLEETIHWVKNNFDIFKSSIYNI